MIIGFLSYRMPDYVDDYLHRTSFADGATITSISQIFPSVGTYYMTWGGRAVSMFFIQLMLMLPKWVFVVCNVCIYVLVANVIYQYAKGDDTLVLSAIYVMLWFFMPDFAEVVTWITGSATYLWTNLVILVFGLLYYRYYCECGADGKTSNGSGNVVLVSILYVVLGFLAGLSNEAGACTILAALAIFAFAMIREMRKLQIYQILGAAAAAAGAALLILAPGNSVRIEASESANAGFLMKYLFRIGREGFYSVMFLAVPVVIGIAVYLYSMYTNHATKRFGIELIFYVLAFISIFVMTFSAGFANRIFQLPLLLICIGFASSLRRILDSNRHQSSSADVAAAPLYKSLSVAIALLTMVALFEVVAGTIYSAGKDSFFDRQMIYYHIYDTEGVLSGNGM